MIRLRRLIEYFGDEIDARGKRPNWTNKPHELDNDDFPPDTQTAVNETPPPDYPDAYGPTGIGGLGSGFFPNTDKQGTDIDSLEIGVDTDPAMKDADKAKRKDEDSLDLTSTDTPDVYEFSRPGMPSVNQKDAPVEPALLAKYLPLGYTGDGEFIPEPVSDAERRGKGPTKSQLANRGTGKRDDFAGGLP